jgi:hypothetical protein
MEYILRDTRTGAVLREENHQAIQQSGGSEPISMMISAINALVTDYRL